jgi:hypothetical protein
MGVGDHVPAAHHLELRVGQRPGETVAVDRLDELVRVSLYDEGGRVDRGQAAIDAIDHASRGQALARERLQVAVGEVDGQHPLTVRRDHRLGVERFAVSLMG